LARWVLERLDRERGYGPAAEATTVLDPQKLTVEQMCRLLDPTRMSEAQIDAVVTMWSVHFEFVLPVPIIDQEPQQSEAGAELFSSASGEPPG
jgi:hypothetical protein